MRSSFQQPIIPGVSETSSSNNFVNLSGNVFLGHFGMMPPTIHDCFLGLRIAEVQIYMIIHVLVDTHDNNAKFRETRKQIYGFWYSTIDYIQSLKNSTKTQWMKKKQWLEINSPLLFQAFLYMDNICNDSSFTGLAARPNHPRKQGPQFS